MGRSGTTSLWSSGLTGHCLESTQDSQFAESALNPEDPRQSDSQLRPPSFEDRDNALLTSTVGQSYRVKPHEQLVLVSLTHYCASTPSLSTFWSRTTLQGARGPGKTHLETSFPLRCFQRLSLPHLATRQCHWRDNRYTRGASTPVLSY